MKQTTAIKYRIQIYFSGVEERITPFLEMGIVPTGESKTLYMDGMITKEFIDYASEKQIEECVEFQCGAFIKEFAKQAAELTSPHRDSKWMTTLACF